MSTVNLYSGPSKNIYICHAEFIYVSKINLYVGHEIGGSNVGHQMSTVNLYSGPIKMYIFAELNLYENKRG